MKKGNGTVKPSGSLLSPAAPQIRTTDAVVRKFEQIEDALENQRITPKIAEQLGQALKGIVGVAKLEMQMVKMLMAFGKRAPVPRNPILRSAIGLAEKVSPADGAAVRAISEAR